MTRATDSALPGDRSPGELDYAPRPASLRARVMSSSLAKAVKRARYGRFATLQVDTAGMLPPPVYRRIYELVRQAPDLDTIEIGGASGSASIAFAWAKDEAGHKSHHIVVEKFEGGTRRRFGGYEDNLERFWRQITQFDAANRIKLFPHYLTVANSAELLGLVETGRIAGFMCDADGRLDRDFRLFLPMIDQRGFVVIDDYHPSRSWKHALVYRLLNRFIDWKLFILEDQISSTVFGRPHPERNLSRIDGDECAEILDSVRVDFGLDRDSEVARMYFR